MNKKWTDPRDEWGFGKPFIEPVKFPIEEEPIKEYLDSAIRHWRKILKDNKHPQNEIAIYYCDAFQSVRNTLFGELLPSEEGDGE